MTPRRRRDLTLDCGVKLPVSSGVKERCAPFSALALGPGRAPSRLLRGDGHSESRTDGEVVSAGMEHREITNF